MSVGQILICIPGVICDRVEGTWAIRQGSKLYEVISLITVSTEANQFWKHQPTFPPLNDDNYKLRD